MIVLSLFDGMAGAYEALTRAGIKVDKYYCSEIDKYSHAVAKYNHPDIINLGDVNNWREWNIETPDLIIGGFPCQAFSFAGKQLHFDDPRGQLFFRLLEIKEHYNPKYFLFENVKMKKEIQAEINKLLKVEPIEIDSTLVSAQNRRRNYWTNIPGITQPADRGILLKEILESDSTEKEKSYCIGASMASGIDKRDIAGKRGKRQVIAVIKNRGEFIEQSEKSMCLDANYFKGPDNHGQRTLIVKAPNGKNVVTLVNWRKLTPLECERLQTVRDGYTETENLNGNIQPISNTQRYKMLGNGFTIEVIAHILRRIK